MLFLETLLKKRYFTKPNGDTVIDLTKSSINMEADTPTEVNIIMVSDDEAMRPDIIAKSTYGDDSKLDFLLKYNGISNPFSLNTGDVLVIPDPFQMAKMFRTPSADETADYNMSIAEFKYMDNLATPDSKRMELLKLKAKNRELLPPNINQPGDKNIKFKNGKVVFGEDVTTINKENCPETLTRARIKEKLLNNQIFK